MNTPEPRTKTYTAWLHCPMREKSFLAVFPTMEQAQECIHRRKAGMQHDVEVQYGKGEFSTYGRGWALTIEESTS